MSGVEDSALLVLNAGSSSLKADVMDESLESVLSVHISGIGQTDVTLRASGRITLEYSFEAQSFDAALSVLFDFLTAHGIATPRAVGYRVVHGGDSLQEPVTISDSVVAKIAELGNIDPEHAPITVQTIELSRLQYPNAVHVACFDTAFFKDIPRTARLLPIPRAYYAAGLQRYGFHGLSYTYLLRAFAAACGDDAARGRVIMAHMGSGVSLAAVKDGAPIDMTMGYSPASGVMMSTRSGDIDPAVYWQLTKQGLSSDDVKQVLNTQSGLLGVSGISSDMYTLLQQEATDEGAHDAVELFCHQIRKSIGAFIAVLGGVDSIIFSGGIGENAPRIRERVLSGLEGLGIVLDSERNARSEERISSDASKTGVHVFRTNEARVIAEEVMRLLVKDQKQEAL